MTASLETHSVWPKVVTAPGGGGPVATTVRTSPAARQAILNIVAGPDQSALHRFEVLEQIEDRLIVGFGDGEVGQLPLAARESLFAARPQQRHQDRHLRGAPAVGRRVAA